MHVFYVLKFRAECQELRQLMGVITNLLAHLVGVVLNLDIHLLLLLKDLLLQLLQGPGQVKMQLQRRAPTSAPNESWQKLEAVRG